VTGWLVEGLEATRGAGRARALRALLPSRCIWSPGLAIAQHLHLEHQLHPPHILPLRAQSSVTVAALRPSSTGQYRSPVAVRMHVSRNERATRQLHCSHHHAL